jgi:CARDB
MPAFIDLDTQVTFVTDPVNPCAGADFTLSWQEKNVGDEASDDYQDVVDVDDQGTGDSQSLDCGGLQPGESAQRSLTFNLPAGDYDINVVINGRGPLFLGNVIID